MVWYYAHDRNRVGPVDDAEFEALVETGVITPETLVWNETLTDWVRYAELINAAPQQTATARQQAPAGQQQAWQTATCQECGRLFPQDSMIRYQNTWVCAGCKPLFIQKLKEGQYLATGMEYAGFWIRFLAKFIDGAIQSAVMIFGITVIGMFMGVSFGLTEDGESGLTAATVVTNVFQLLSFAFGVFYNTFFIGKFGATPGKMICGLKVVMAEGRAVTYPRALGRHFAEWLSSLILLIGYIMAAFDEEKRTLHDRICDTRVVKK